MVYFQHEIASKVVMYQLVIFKKIAKELWKLGEKIVLRSSRKDSLAHSHCQHEQQKE